VSQTVQDTILGAELGATIGAAVGAAWGGVGAAVGAVLGFTVGELAGWMDPDCDGPVANAYHYFNSETLRAQIAANNYIQQKEQLGQWPQPSSATRVAQLTRKT
jgi:phage tail tape-measure protein